MDNYEDLIKALRHCWVQNRCDGCPFYASDKQTEQCAKMNTLAADAIEDLEFACNRYEKDYKALCAYLPKWIPVTERLPEDDCNCIVFSDGYVKESHFYFGKFYDPIEDYMRYKATYWMPLPEPPKEEVSSDID